MASLKHTIPILALVIALASGCVNDPLDALGDGRDGNIPAGYARLDIRLAAVNGKAFVTRADPDPLMSFIDDVHLLVFRDSNNDGIIEDTDPVVVRNFYQYGVMQNVYIKKGDKYYIFVVANLHDSNCPEGDVDTFFDDVNTYGDLKNTYVQFLERTPQDLGKMIMATDGIVPIELPVGQDVFSPTVSLQRLQSKFIVNIYNRVNPADNSIISGVYPSTLTTVDFPRYSFVMERQEADYTDGKYDYAFTLPEVSDGFYESQADFLPAVAEVVEYPAGSGRWYSRQTVEMFCFENRRGSVADINDYGDGGAVKDVYGRSELAPDYSTYVRLASLTQGNALLTYVHAGQGRDVEDTATPDDITNFDVDRSCIYHFNIYINGVNDVNIDTRRQYLDQIVIFTLPDVRRIDAHYMDIPSFILGTTPGYAKLQSGTCDVDSNGEIIYDGLVPRNLVFMQDTDADAVRWLRFSWGNPYNPSVRPVNTSLYAGMTRVDGVSGATPVLHFNEYVTDVQQASTPAVNPSRRTAVIKVGFVAGATSAAQYDEGAANDLEAAFYVPVSQYGLKTIGYVGGYQNGTYTSLLGVESVEEYTLRYYSREGYPRDEINNGPYWQYRTGPVYHNQAYDGKLATTDHYNDYRGLFADDIPPKRWDVTPGGVYNPQSNTNAADYCMRKNRDEDGNGIIEGDEIKWYLPTPVQAMQMYTWRNAFKGGNYTLNLDYVPFGNTLNSPSRYYWTTNEESAGAGSSAYAVDFAQAAAMTETVTKTQRNPVRCVRDIPAGDDQSMFYYSGGYMVADLTGNFPDLDTRKVGKGENVLRDPGYNTLGRTFLISRWYASVDNSGNPAQASGNSGNCSSYNEGGYSWFLPSQQELSLIYAYSGMIDNIFAQNIPGTPNTPSTYHTFTSGPHWGITNVGDNSTYWRVDFATGAAATYKKGQNNGYYRCVTYLTNPLPKP